MGRYLPAIMIAVCSASCFGVEPVVTLPAEVSGDVGAFIRVEAETNGAVVQWFEDEPGLNLFPVDLLKDTRVAVVTASREGKYRLLAYTAIGDMPSRPAVVTIVVGKVPPTPGPTPGPDVPTPPTDPLARKVYDAALAVQSDNRAAEAKMFADIFDAVAGQAAGVSDMDVSGMVQLTSRRMQSDISPEVRMKWDAWKRLFSTTMKEAGLATKDQHIEAWSNIASALRSVR